MSNIIRYLGDSAVWKWIKNAGTPIYIFFITRLLMVFAVFSGIILFANMGAMYVQGPSMIFLVNSFCRWDSGHYADILSNGYKSPDSAAFFPMYPFLGRFVNIFTHNPFVSLLIVSNISFLFAVIFIYKLVRDKYGEECAGRTAFYISIFPTSFFFTCALSESIFLLMTVLAFYFAEKEEWGFSGLFGIFCGLTRSVGIFMIIPIGIIYLAKKRYDIRRIESDIIPVLLMPLGILILMAILMMSGRPPLDFITAGHIWDRFYAWPWWDIARSIGQVSATSFVGILKGQFMVKTFLSVSLVSLFLVLSVCTLFEQGAGYGIYALMSLLFFLSNPSKQYALYGDLRYIIVIFPVFILLAKYGKNRYIDHLIVTFSLLMLGILAVFNGLGGWIS